MRLRSHRAITGRAVTGLLAVVAGTAMMVSPATAATTTSAPAPAASSTAVAIQDLSYTYTYSTGMTWPQSALQTPASVMTAVANDFRRYFTFDSNCSRLPAVGGTCDLYVTPLIVNPVKVTGRTATSFTFVSLPGHAEGPGRVITFTFYQAGTVPFTDMRLHVAASGPYSLAADLTISSGAAYEFWRTFATTVGRAFS